MCVFWDFLEEVVLLKEPRILFFSAGWLAVFEGRECATPSQHQKGHPGPEDQQLWTQLSTEAAIWWGSIWVEGYSARAFLQMTVRVCKTETHFFLETAGRAAGSLKASRPASFTFLALFSCIPSLPPMMVLPVSYGSQALWFSFPSSFSWVYFIFLPP